MKKKYPEIISPTYVNPEVRLQMIATVAAGICANISAYDDFSSEVTKRYIANEATKIVNRIIWPDEK